MYTVVISTDAGIHVEQIPGMQQVIEFITYMDTVFQILAVTITENKRNA